MTSSLDYEDLFQDWHTQIEGIQKGFPGHKADVRQSEDAGRYLCDYIYFNSLAYFGRRCGKLEGGDCSARPVLFCKWSTPRSSKPSLILSSFCFSACPSRKRCHYSWKRSRSCYCPHSSNGQELYSFSYSSIWYLIRPRRWSRGPMYSFHAV